jgi:hypothetical protein
VSNPVTNLCRQLVMSPAQKSVLMCLADRASDEGLAWPSVPWMCEWTCLGRTAVMEAIKWLESTGLITVQRETGRNNRIALLLDAITSFNQSASRTSPAAGPVRLAYPTSPAAGRGVVRETDGSSPSAGPETSIHQEDIRDTATTGKPAVPECPHRDLIALFGKHLPGLPQPRPELWAGKNAEAMRSRWRWVMTAVSEGGKRYAKTADEATAFFDLFFEHVASSDFLSGRSGKWTGCDLGWLMKADNFAKVVQGNYDNKPEATPARREYA